VIPLRGPLGLWGYDVDGASTSLEQHERGIDALRPVLMVSAGQVVVQRTIRRTRREVTRS